MPRIVILGIAPRNSKFVQFSQREAAPFFNDKHTDLFNEQFGGLKKIIPARPFGLHHSRCACGRKGKNCSVLRILDPFVKNNYG